MKVQTLLSILLVLPCHIHVMGNEPIYRPDIEVYMQIGSSFTSHLSSDGQTLFFLTRLTGATQMYRVHVDGGWPMQLTFFPDGIDFYSLSPSERWAVVGVSSGGNEQSQLYLVDARTGRSTQLTDKPEARFGVPIWSPDERSIAYGSNQVDPESFYIYTMDIRSGETDLVLRRGGYNTVADWSADGTTLLVRKLVSSANTDLYLVDLEKEEDILLTPHQGDVEQSHPLFTPDGRGIYLITNARQDRMGLAYLDLASREIAYVVEDVSTPWEVQELSLSEDGRFLAWIVNEEGYGRLKIYDLMENRYAPSPPKDGICGGVSFSDDGEIAFSFTSPSQTTDIWLWNWRTSHLKKITHSTYAGIDPDSFVEPELITYNSFDGLTIPAFLYLPPNYNGGKIPFIVDVHGGPESQFRPFFYRHFQYLLHHGYGILAPNIRGSSGYGKRFAQLDDYRHREDAVKDVERGARWLIESGYTEASQLAIKGASYGGYMTLAALTTYPHLFAAGIDNVGIANFVTFLERTKPYRRALREAEYGPLDDSEFLRRISPLTSAHKIEAPLLVVHGHNDPRVPISEARQIAEAIRQAGGTVDTLFFRDEGHGIEKLSNNLVFYRRMVNFLDRHLKKKD